MGRTVVKLANKEYTGFIVGSAFTREKGLEVPTSNEATTNNRFVVYTVICKSCGKTEKKTKQAIQADSTCKTCGALHEGINETKRSSKSSLAIFKAGSELVMFRLNAQDAEVAFRTQLEYSHQYSKWRSEGSKVFEADADLLHLRPSRACIFEQQGSCAPPELTTLNGLPTYTLENVDAATRAAYEAELTQPITYPEPSDTPVTGEVFTTTVTRAQLEKHACYFDNLTILQKALTLRPVAPNQRSGWLASASTRTQILAGRSPAAYTDATTNFESVATYPVNDIEEPWYYLYEYAPSSADDIPDFD